MPGPSTDWGSFISRTRDRPPWQRVVDAAARFAQPGEALDLGAGGGRDTRHLLLEGWHVTAVDASPAAAAVMRAMPRQRWLRFVETRIEAFAPETYDLVNAQFSLPFLEAADFRRVVAQLVEAVRPSGILTATFFGPNDEWNQPGSTLSFVAREDIPGLLSPLDILGLDEEDHDGETADGSAKHWHVFHVVAGRP